jgi:hypothetical protein
MKKVLFSSLAVTALVLVAQVIVATPVLPLPPVQTPIDGGLTLVIGGGIAYVAKKAYDKRKNNEV